ncbi:MAG TPA: YkvA family protein, partial [Gemmatimonas sp.]|nr:YkvA family protein [Gemmatimonas sp.]
LFGLMGDRRVSKVDRFFVVAAAAYMISPLDFIPDLIPFFGQVDDLFLVVTALQRLVDNTGRRVLLDHWQGDPDELSDVNLTTLVSAAGFFLPGTVRQGLRRLIRRRKS